MFIYVYINNTIYVQAGWITLYSQSWAWSYQRQ